MSKHSHMFTGAMVKITNRKFVAPARGLSICGDEEAREIYAEYCYHAGKLDESNIYDNDILPDGSVEGNKKVTCPDCIKILK